MNKILLLVGVASVIAVAVFYVLVDDNRLTDEEIFQGLRCDRITLEVLATDYYCNNIDLYRSDLEEGNLLDEDWGTAQEQLRERGLIE